jgi:hypothetical protein
MLDIFETVSALPPVVEFYVSGAEHTVSAITGSPSSFTIGPACNPP